MKKRLELGRALMSRPRLLLLDEPANGLSLGEVEDVMRLIKASFLQARKKLSNALPSGLAAMGMRVEKERAVAALNAAGVDPNRRAETVALQQWVRVYRALSAQEERASEADG